MRTPNRSPAAGLVAATLLAGSGGVVLTDIVFDRLMAEQIAHVALLERELAGCQTSCETFDYRLEDCRKHLAEALGHD